VPIAKHVYEQDFELYRTGFLPNGRDSVLVAHPGECKPCIVKLSKANQFLSELPGLSAKQASHDGKDKRREHRFVANDSAVVQILNPFSDEYWGVSLLDVSKNGLRLHVPIGVMPGSLVKVRIKNGIAFGDARYCVPAIEGFFVGVQLHDYVSGYAAPFPPKCADKKCVGYKAEIKL
jgi:hypothetical protein